MENRDVTAYMGKAINELIKDIVRKTIINPRETAFFLTFGNACKKADKIRKKYEDEGIHVPAFLIGSITSKCNLFCTGCYARENAICSETVKEEVLSAKQWEAIFDEAGRIGVSFFLLAGGEPLLQREIIINASAHENILFPIFTNGTLIDETYINLFRKKRNLIPVVSLEGSRERTETRRGSGTYQKIMNTLSKLKDSGILYGVSITVTTENYMEVTDEDFIDKLREIGCRLVFFIEYVPITKGSHHLAPTEKERTYFEQKQITLIEKYKEIIFVAFPGDEKYTGGCLAAGRGFFHINPYGGAEPCPFSPFSDSNLKTMTLIEALQSPLFKKLSQLEFVGGPHDGGCSLFAHEQEIRKLCK
ncbi:MAG: radical SAM protein [Clostridia bacterium]|nr:radical SAM protein [Clostridia bacterium]